MDTLHWMAAASAASCAPTAAASPSDNDSTTKTMIPVTRTTRRASASGQLSLYESLRHLKSSATLQLVLFIFALLFVSHFGYATATPLPSISGPSSKQQQEIAEAGSSSSSSISEGSSNKSPIVQQQQQGSSGGDTTKQATKTNTAEKLKRGLTSFMNQLNPAPFFVPPVQQQPKPAGEQANSLKGAEPKTPNSSSAEPATIVTGDSSLVLKGPASRWAFARPIGGPLRWGRR